MMKLQSIENLLDTVCRFNFVKITQVFTKEDTDWISVRCLPGTSMFELTYLKTGQIEYHTSIVETAKIIDKQITSSL